MNLTIITYNVHNFMLHGKCNLSGVVDALRDEKADVIFLQEVIHPSSVDDGDSSNENQGNNAKLELLAKHLDMNFVEYGSFSSASPYGNAIVSRLPIVQFFSYNLGHHRSLLEAMIELNEQFTLRVFNLHLDHRSEKKRVEELDIVFDIIDNCVSLNDKIARNVFGASRNQQILPQHQPIDGYLLCGDFNSLSSSEHYNSNEWMKIVDDRKASNWEKPRTEIYEILTKKRLHCDLFWQFHSKSNENVTGFGTCRFNTRIDYIFASQQLYNLIQIENAKLIDSNASDHKPVVVQFSIMTKSTSTSTDEKTTRASIIN